MLQKSKKKTLLYLFFSTAICLSGWASEMDDTKEINSGKWKILYNEKSHALDYSYDGKIVLKDVYVKAKNTNDTISSGDYQSVALKKDMVTDAFGTGEKYTLTYSAEGNKPKLEQIFYFYPDKEYLLTEAYILSDDEISSNYIAPIYTDAKNSFLTKDASNRVLRVPFDNDGFVRYLSSPLNISDVSFEVTSIFNGNSRAGLVIGSVEHDTWKTGVAYSASENQYITHLQCYGGIVHKLTRDIPTNGTKPTVHGSIKGKSLKSPKIMLGIFGDWRKGMEEYGEANATIAPPRKWNMGTPFGWNSWAAMAEKVNYEGAVDVSDFVKANLQSNNFENDNTVFIGLDSYWDNFSDDELRKFVENCQKNGQRAGIYWCPFSDWWGDGNRNVEGTAGEWKYKDLYLYVGGSPRKIASLALDPTHPGTKKLMEHYIRKFKALGFTYIKLDFINNATLEADSFYNPKVTTGVQAYNEGMSHLMQLCGDDMFTALSIAPMFPAQYGTSRRISCDTWGAMHENDWGSTGYMLNSLSFAWWLDRVYTFNDADHILLYKPSEANDYKDGANRSRITSAVITGIYMLGDNFSFKGSFQGEYDARVKAKQFATNKDINDIARIGKSFYPVEGHKAVASDRSENFFMYETDKYLYFVAFNFDSGKELKGNMQLSRLTNGADNISTVKELWSGQSVQISNKSIPYSVAAQDVQVFRAEKSGYASIEDETTDNEKELFCYQGADNNLHLESNKVLKNIKIYSISGSLVLNNKLPHTTSCQVNVRNLAKGAYIVNVQTAEGKKLKSKFIR